MNTSNVSTTPPAAPPGPLPCPRPTAPGTRLVLAHRGAGALAPENTLAAFGAAADHGARWIELDVDVLADGTLLVLHDSTLDRTTDRSGRYDHLTAADLAGTDAGSWFSPDFAGEPLPTLGACLELARRRRLEVNVELKSTLGGAQAVDLLVTGAADALDEHLALAPDRQVLVSSFNPLLLDRMGRRRPGTRLAWLTEALTLGDDWRSVVETVGAEAVNPADRGLARSRVQEIRSLGYGVNVWTVNSRTRVNELFNWGVTGVFTDRIHELGGLARPAGDAL